MLGEGGIELLNTSFSHKEKEIAVPLNVLPPDDDSRSLVWKRCGPHSI